MILKRQEAIEHIRGQLPEYLEQTGRSTRKNFSCCNPQHTDKNPSCSYDRKRNKAHCFGCNTDFDTLDFIAFDNGTGADFNATLARAAEYFNITIVNDTEYSKGERGGTMQEKPVKQEEYKKPEEYEVQEIKADFTEYIKSCRAALSGSQRAIDYLTGRGLSLETIERFSLGYDSNKDQIIIPYNKSNSYFIGRGISKKSFYKVEREKAGAEPVYNALELFSTDRSPIFIVEAPFCAISIMQAGGKAIALGGVGIDKLADILRQTGTPRPFIICLDNDPTGKTNTQKLKELLTTLKASFIEYNIAGEHKDPNEALQADPEAFTRAVKAAAAKVLKPDNIIDYLDNIFTKDIAQLKNYKEVKTGFSNLDNKIGSLYPGLYAIGAISSLGKTTFTHQIADQIAAAGHDVLFFSLEQSRFELASKSIARLTAQANIQTASNALSIRKGDIFGTGSDKEKAVLKAYQDYKRAVGDKISIIEGNFDTNIDTIKRTVENYIKNNGVKPIVIVDYLQVIQSDPAQKVTTREAIDIIVTELKRLSRDKDIVVIVISSLNRNNYLSPIDFESFKESGGIEYTSDVVWGLQLQAMNNDIFNKEKSLKEKRELVRTAKAENPRKIEFVCLKNRYGRSSFKIGLIYYPEFDYFKPDPSYTEE